MTSIWLWISIAFAIGTFVISSHVSMPSILTRIWRHFDWVLHGLEYGLLAWFGLLYLRDIGLIERNTVASYLLVIVFAGVVGGLNELWQDQMPNRLASWGDEIANLVGAAISAVIFHLLMK